MGFLALGGVISLSRSVTGVYGTVATTATSTESRSSVVDALREELRSCRLHSVATDGSSVTYSLPIQAGTYGGFTDDKGNILYGANATTGFSTDATITLAFVKKSEISESTAGDLNGDGDTADTYELGYLAKTTSTGITLPFPRIELIRLKGSLSADLNKDGKADPLFAWDATNNKLSVNLCRRNQRGKIGVFSTAFSPAAQLTTP